MKTTTKSYVAKPDQTTIVVIDKTTNEGIVCDESALADALHELSIGFPNISINHLPEEAVTYRYEQCGSRYGGETYESVRDRIAALWGFDRSDIDYIDWIEEHPFIDGDMHVCTPNAVDYTVRTKSGREVSYATDFVRNYLTD